MTDFLTVETSISSVSVPAPPVSFNSETVSFPTIGPYTLPTVSFGPFSFDLPNVRIPEITVPSPFLRVGSDIETFSFSELVPLPDVDLPYLDKDYERISLPIIDRSFSILDPFGTELRGGSVGLDYERIGASFGIRVPDPRLSISRRTFGGQRFTFPDIDIDGVEFDLPDIPEIDLPSVTVPVSAALDGSVSVADPTSLSVSVAVEWAAVQDFVLDDLPTDFVSEPAQWVFSAVLSELQSNVTGDTAAVISDVAEGFLELLLSDETKERLRERGSDR